MVTSETKNPYAVIRNNSRKHLSNIERQTSLKSVSGYMHFIISEKNGEY